MNIVSATVEVLDDCPERIQEADRLKSLGENYTEDAIKRRLTENQKVLIVPFAKETVRVRQYRMPQENTKSKRSADCMGCICITAISWVICRSTKNRIPQGFTIF